MSDKIKDPEAFVNGIVQLAEHFEGQPVAVTIDENGEMQVGVMSLMYPHGDDWCLNPVPVEKFPPPHLAES